MKEKCRLLHMQEILELKQTKKNEIVGDKSHLLHEGTCFLVRIRD